MLAVARRLHESQRPARVHVPWHDVEPLVRELLGQRQGDPDRPPDLYVVVEKILGYEEPFPENWRQPRDLGLRHAQPRSTACSSIPGGAVEFTRALPGVDRATTRLTARSSARRSC